MTKIQTAPSLYDALQLAVRTLNEAPRFPVRDATYRNSYEVIPVLEATLAQASRRTPSSPRGDLPQRFDNYEIHGVKRFAPPLGLEEEPQGRMLTEHYEQVEDAAAEFWSLFGHIPGQGLECIGDFDTRAHAEEVYARITGKPYYTRLFARTGGTKPLPPDPEGRNDDRASWAGHAITAFREATGTDVEDALPDLLTDLIHWADRQDYDFEAALRRARAHYDAETGGEE
jgi:hypothetical protein